MAEEKVKKVKETDNRLDASMSGFPDHLGKLDLITFTEWFDKHYKGDSKKVHAELVKNLKK